MTTSHTVWCIIVNACVKWALLTSNPFRSVPPQMIPGVHDACWITSFLSFVFLYPSTFNLLEVRRDSRVSSAVTAKKCVVVVAEA